MGCINSLPTIENLPCDHNYNGSNYSFTEDYIYRDGEKFAKITDVIEIEDKVIQVKANIECGNQYMDGSVMIATLNILNSSNQDCF